MRAGRIIHALIIASVLAIPGIVGAQDERRQGNPYFPSNIRPDTPIDAAPAPSPPTGPEILPLPQQPAPKYRYAVPDLPTQTRADRLMKQIYASDYKDPRPTATRSLAIKLLRQAFLTTDDPPMKYVLFRESRDLAVSAGYMNTALQAAIGWSTWFQIEPLPLEMETVKRATNAVHAPAAVAALVKTCLDQARRDALGGNAQAANRFCDSAEIASQKTRNADFVAATHAESERIRELLQLMPMVASARATLKDKPDDPRANAVAGRYLCFIAGQWVEGLPMLLKSSDDALKALAQKDKDAMAAGNASADSLLADSWWQYAEGHTGIEYFPSRQRAAFWYSKAQPSLTGMLRQVVDKRIAEQKIDGLALRPQIIHVSSRLTGTHKLTITTDHAQWTHDSVNMPKEVGFSGIDWKPRTNPRLLNIGIDEFLAPGTDLSTAQLNKQSGKGAVTLEKTPATITVTIEDPGPQLDNYEFDIIID
jgi:hypothetical protein